MLLILSPYWCANLKEEYDSLVAQKRYIEANELLVSVYPSSKWKWNRGEDVFVDDTLFYDERKGYIRWQQEYSWGTKRTDCDSKSRML